MSKTLTTYNSEPITLNSELKMVPIAALNQYAYCPHRCWRMFCAGEFADNEYTIEGTALHTRVHTLSTEQIGETFQIRAIWLASEQYGLSGKADLIEFENGQSYPVEYKRGHRGEWDNDALQVCAQALCLEEITDRAIATGYVYYAQTHRRQPIAIDESLRQETVATIEAVRHLLTTGEMPPPVYGSHCKGCSLYERCLPQAVKKVKRYREE